MIRIVNTLVMSSVGSRSSGLHPHDPSTPRRPVSWHHLPRSRIPMWTVRGKNIQPTARGSQHLSLPVSTWPAWTIPKSPVFTICFHVHPHVFKATAGDGVSNTGLCRVGEGAPNPSCLSLLPIRVASHEHHCVSDDGTKYVDTWWTLVWASHTYLRQPLPLLIQLWGP